MVKVDLITGFLGSGKTTFIKKYAAWLMSQGQNIGILENDFGAVNVDMMLLHDLEGENCELEMVSGGCDADCHRRRFKTKLIAMGMCGYDRVLIEPSGIFDVDEFFDALYEEPLDKWYQIGNVITILDARLEEKLQPQAEYILASEAADAGCIVLSKSQEASEEEISGTVKHLNRALESVKCKRRFTENEILNKNWEKFTDEDFQKIFYDTDDYTYGSKSHGAAIEDLLNSGKKFVYFASIQDLRGSSTVGGKFDKNDAVFSLDWDLVIVDEAHEGTTTALGDDVIKNLVKEGNSYDTKFLALSGTPFNILKEFDDNIYTWDYVMEQQRKAEWDKLHFGDSNHYDELPELKIYTYDLGKILTDKS